MRPLAVIVGAGHIGRAVAQRLDARGFAVAIVCHDELELCDEVAIESFFGRFERIDVLVNAAGGYGALGRVRDVAPSNWRRSVEINLLGVYACCHHALPRLVSGGHIVNLAGGGKGPFEERSGYVASKSGLWRLTETLAAEEPALRVNAIAPGPMWSRMQEAVVGRVWAKEIEALREGHGAVPVENTLRALDHILDARPTGQLFFARKFSARLQAVSVQ